MQTTRNDYAEFPNRMQLKWRIEDVSLSYRCMSTFIPNLGGSTGWVMIGYSFQSF